ncbi:MAG: prolyl oligopeptidase family serine peptidase [Thermoguttaceae bacterium]|nr:prolyl oligopeptidase family serine peptidase [Thermoguttaceae bacterium]MDW8079783.1 prolyl oligopeptidase family serine peptidase [Thermoguttaceae bacterium]
MSRRKTFGVAKSGRLVRLIALFILLATSAQANASSSQLVAVSRVSEGEPFVYECRQIANEPNYFVYSVRYPSPVKTPLATNNIVPGELFMPRHAGPSCQVPAVICLHILSGDRELMELACAALASRGIAAFMFRLPYYGERGGTEGPRIVLKNPSLFVDAIRQAWADIRRAVDLLSSRPEILGDRVSVFGVSFGGIVALGAAAEEPRLWRTLAVLAGGNLIRIMEHAKETAALRQALGQMSPSQREAFLQTVKSVDPIVLVPKLREKASAGRILLINAQNDEVIPRSCTEELAAALGLQDQVIWLEDVGHYSSLSKLPEVLEITVGFFAQDLKDQAPEAGKPPVDEKLATGLLARLLQQVVALLTGELEPGRGHLVELSGWVQRRTSAERIRFSLFLARGSGGQFSFKGQLPEVGRVAFGQQKFPWIQAATGRVFVGSLVDEDGASGAANAAEGKLTESSSGGCPADPLRFAEPAYLDQVKMAVGIAAAISIAPELLLKRGIRIEGTQTTSGYELRLSGAIPQSAEVKIRLAGEDQKPRSITLAIADWTGELDIHQWEINKPVAEDVFSPPTGQTQEVPCYEVHRMFGAVFNFLVSRLTGK